jgi:GLPGLI family protein
MINDMKRGIITVIGVLSLFIGNILAQSFPVVSINIDKYQVLDSAYLKCTYRLTSVKDTSNAEQKKSGLIDIQTLQIGKVTSKYFSQVLQDFYTKVQEFRKKGDTMGRSYVQDGVFEYQIFKNQIENKTTVLDCGSRLGIGTAPTPNFRYEDDLSDMKWEIKKDTATILSYSCQKAITEFRGRTWEAWFTSEIPINNGPWKFGGLPGLIIKVTDSQNYFVFECIGIENLKEREPIKFYDLKYADITRKNLNKLYIQLYNNLIAYNLAIGIELRDNTGKLVTHCDKIPYNPIEFK